MTLELSKLGPIDPAIERVVLLTERLLDTRISIEANARKPDFSIEVIQGLERQQAALFAELHQAMDRLTVKVQTAG